MPEGHVWIIYLFQRELKKNDHPEIYPPIYRLENAYDTMSSKKEKSWKGRPALKWKEGIRNIMRNRTIEENENSHRKRGKSQCGMWQSLRSPAYVCIYGY